MGHSSSSGQPMGRPLATKVAAGALSKRYFTHNQRPLIGWAAVGGHDRDPVGGLRIRRGLMRWPSRLRLAWSLDGTADGAAGPKPRPGPPNPSTAVVLQCFSFLPSSPPSPPATPPPPTTTAVTSSPSGGIFDTPHTATPQLFMAFVAASSGPRLTRSGAFAPTPRCRFSQARPWDRDEAPPRAGEAQPEGLSGVGLPS